MQALFSNISNYKMFFLHVPKAQVKGLTKILWKITTA